MEKQEFFITEKIYNSLLLRHILFYEVIALQKFQDGLLGWMDKAEIPGEAVLSIPMIQLTGFHKVSVEPQDGLLEYSNDRVLVAIRGGNLTVSGDDLEITLMKEDRLELCGKIREIKLEQTP